MGKLTEKQRAKLPPQAFGLPEQARFKQARKEAGSSPMPDHDHAISALRRSERERERGRGNLTKDECRRIQRTARRILRGSEAGALTQGARDRHDLG